MKRQGLGSRRQLTSVLTSPFRQLADSSSLSGKLLLVALLAALAWANTPWRDGYHSFWQHTQLGFVAGSRVISLSLLYWLNDGLMAVFFFLVGLEVKRELLAGELSRPGRAALPVAAAAGGMAVPAIIFLLLQAPGGGQIRGWAIPTATDIAFALGILNLTGRRAPTSLKVFLTALAIVDDIGAVILISLFYSEPPLVVALLAAAAVLTAMLALNAAGVRAIWLYVLLSLAVWLCFLFSGVHATVAGVLAALTIPVRPGLGRRDVAATSLRLAGQLGDYAGSDLPTLGDRNYQRTLEKLARLSRAGITPLQQLERRLHPFVAYFVLPLFALANGGIAIDRQAWADLVSPLGLGIIAGLVIGKPLGIAAACCGLERLGLVSRPADLSRRQLVAGGCFAGIGFTMSIFIASLAFNDPLPLAQAKLAVLTASFIASLLGGALLLKTGRAAAASPPGRPKEKTTKNKETR